MSTTNQTARVLELIKRFNNGEKISIDSLSTENLWYGKCPDFRKSTTNTHNKL
jgi:hypothetical protein